MFNQSFSPWGMSGCFLRRLVAYTRDCRSRTLELYSTYHVLHFLPPRNVCFGVFPISSHGCPTTQCLSLASMPSSKHVFRFSHSTPVLADMYNLLDVYLHSVSLKPGLFFLQIWYWHVRFLLWAVTFLEAYTRGSCTWMNDSVRNVWKQWRSHTGTALGCRHIYIRLSE